MINLDDKIKEAERTLRLAAEMSEHYYHKPLIVCYSGGKDSDVCLRLAQMAGIRYRAIYKNTTIDPPGTIAHAQVGGGQKSYVPRSRSSSWWRRWATPIISNASAVGS